MMRSIAALFAGSLLLAGACADNDKKPGRYELLFRVTDDLEEGIANIPITVGETNIGITDHEGRLRAEVNSHDGDRYALRAPCPEDYDLEQAPDEVVFMDTKGLGGDRSTTISLRIVCKRRIRVAALLVHADGHEGMPILVNGVPRATTGPDGFAHLRLEGEPSTQFEVTLDTSSKPDLLPRNPRHEMQMGGSDELFVFDPVFSQVEVEPVAKPKRRKRRVKKEAPAPRRPVKID